MQRRRGADLVEAAVGVDPFEGRVQGEALPYVALDQLSLYRPLFRRLGIAKPFAQSIDEDEAGHLL